MCRIYSERNSTCYEEILNLLCDCRTNNVLVGLKKTCCKAIRTRSFIRMYSEHGILDLLCHWGGDQFCIHVFSDAWSKGPEDHVRCRRIYRREDVIEVARDDRGNLFVLINRYSLRILNNSDSITSSPPLCSCVKIPYVSVTQGQP